MVSPRKLFARKCLARTPRAPRHEIFRQIFPNNTRVQPVQSSAGELMDLARVEENNNNNKNENQKVS